MKKKHIWFTIAILYCLAIFITTASPSSTGGNTLSVFARLFNLSGSEAAVMNVIFRKSVHLLAFGVLAFLFYNSFEKNRYVKAWSLTTLYAASDEIHQAFLPDRTGAILDVGFDSLGALLALILIRVWGYLPGPKRKKQYERKTT